MKRHAWYAATATLLLATSIANAEDKRAGTKKHVTAYEADQATVIDVDFCPSGYMACGNAFRDKIKARLCARSGAGKHEWYYQVGDSASKIKNTAICDGSSSGAAKESGSEPPKGGAVGSPGSYDLKYAGMKGYVTAYEGDGVSIIDVDSCPNGYSSCGSAFRERIKNQICRKLGPGNHTWHYQIGDAKTKIKNTAYCK